MIKSGGNAYELTLDRYFEEVSYGIRLSYRLPSDPETAAGLKYVEDFEWWDWPLSYSDVDPKSFYPLIKPAFLGDPIPTNAFKELMTIKRIKAYGLVEVDYWPSGTACLWGPAGVATWIFSFPLIEQEKDVTTSKSVSSLISTNWHDQYDYKSDDRPNYISLYGEMKKTKEFKLLFEYVFPATRMLSLATMYNITTLEDLGYEQGTETLGIFDPTKSMLYQLINVETMEV